MQVLWTEAFPTQIDGIWIKPGWNEIPDSLRGHRVVRHLINRGRLSIKGAEEDAAVEQTPLEKDLAGIRATFDLKVLKKLAKADKRPEVVAAIEAQVAEIQRLKDEAKTGDQSGEK
jgi:hypothetical protein